MKRRKISGSVVSKLKRYLTTSLITPLLILVAAPAYAQTFTVLHQFSGPDGANPDAGLTADQAGNFYGTTSSGGNNGCQSYGCGTVFKLSRSGSGWVLNTIYIFQGNSDGAVPIARVVFGPDGALYGTTLYGGDMQGSQDGYGTVFKLTPPATVCKTVSCPWTHTVLYQFNGTSDGANPGSGDLVFDSAGNIYGTTQTGGVVQSSCFMPNQGCGVVFKLTPSSGSYTESVLYSFTSGAGGNTPMGGVIFDPQGNLYGTAYAGGSSNYGTVFELTPSSSGWNETVLHSMNGFDDGEYPAASLISDSAGNLYGTVSANVSDYHDGVVFELAGSGNGWTFNTLYLFPHPAGLLAPVTLFNGNLYSTTVGGGADSFGSAFELVSGSGGWTPSTLYSFTSNNDGSHPVSGVLLDSSGNVYGTAMDAGENSDGTVWEITSSDKPVQHR